MSFGSEQVPATANWPMFGDDPPVGSGMSGPGGT